MAQSAGLQLDGGNVGFYEEHSGRVCRIFAKSRQTTIRIATAGRQGKNAQGICLPDFGVSQDAAIRIAGLGEFIRIRLLLASKGKSRCDNPDRHIFEGRIKIGKPDRHIFEG